MGRSAKIELYMCYLRHDSWAGEVAFDQEKATNLVLQAKLDSIKCEHGDAYGIQPHFGILTISTHPGIGFVKTLCLCTMISFLVGLPPSIEKSPLVALPSLTRLTLTCLNSCSTISISAMLWRERLTEMMFWNCGLLSRLCLKSVQTRRTALSPCMKASCVLWFQPQPSHISLLPFTLPVPSKLNYTLLVSLQSPYKICSDWNSAALSRNYWITAEDDGVSAWAIHWISEGR